jgi:hypothetical protein
MGSQYPSSQNSQVPAECYNRLRLAYSREGGYFQIPVVGLSDNIMMISGSQWRCWNRKLGVLLISWQDFRTSARTALDQPVPCTMTIHHSYSRTVIHRIYDGLLDTVKRTEPLIGDTPTARIVPITQHLQRPPH